MGASKKPASKKPASKKPASKKPASKKPASKKPASKKKALPPALAEALEAPADVEELELVELGLRDVPPEIERLTNLRRLNVGANELTELPAFLARLSKLEELDVSVNEIDEVAPELGALPLRKLVISGLDWPTVPPSFDVLLRLPTLEDLTIHSQQDLTEVPRVLAGHPRLARLDLRLARSLGTFPDILFDLPRLRELLLASACFGELPTEVRGLSELRSLHLGDTGITRFPRAFCELPLEDLTLGDNDDLVLDDEIARLTELRRLRLNNVYKPLPAAIGRLVKLRRLSLSNRSIPDRVAPSWLAGLVDLEELDVSNCPDLEEIPDSVLSLPNLKKLIVYNSPLAKEGRPRAIEERFPHLQLRV